MFSVYVDDTCIFNDVTSLADFELISPKLTLTANSAGQLDMTVPVTNIGYGLIEQMTSNIYVYKDNEEIWMGRVLSEQMDFQNNRKLVCEGELAFLNDTIQPPAEYHDISPRDLLETFLTIHNQKIQDDTKKFYVGAVTVTDPNDSLYRYTNYESTLDAIFDKLIDRLGGYLQIRKVDGKRYLDWLEELPDTTTQQIRFGSNLLDYTVDWDQSDFCTVVIPKGARLEESPIEALEAYVTVEDVNNGSIYVYDEDTVKNFGWIEKVVTFDDVELPENLLRKAKEYLEDMQFDTVTLEVSALDLHYLDNTIEDIWLLDRVRVISEPHGMDRLFPVEKVEIPLDSPEETRFTLGLTSLEGYVSSSNRINTEIQVALDEYPFRIKSAYEKAVENATALINMYTNGFFTVVTNDNGTNEVFFSSEQDYESADRVWRWNMNGLGYSSNGWEGPFETAITMDGGIVGKFITAQSITADKINIEYTNLIEEKITVGVSDANNYTNTKLADYWTIQQVTTEISNNGERVRLAAESRAIEIGQGVLTDSKQYTDTKLLDYATSASLEVEKDQILAKVNENYEYLTNNYLTTVETKSLIDQTANSINLSVSSLENRIDNINIGARNLLLNSNFWKDIVSNTVPNWTRGNYCSLTKKDNTTYGQILKVSITSTNSAYFYQSLSGDRTIKSGQEYTISFDAYGSQAMTIYPFLSSVAANAIPITTSWARYHITYKPTSTSTSMYFYIKNASTSSTLYLANVKLEKGNVATQWTLAPEDMDGKIESSEARIKITTDSIEQSVNSVSQEIKDLNIGGRNLILNSNFWNGLTDWYTYSSSYGSLTYSSDSTYGQILRFTSATSSSSMYKRVYQNLSGDRNVTSGTDIVISFHARVSSGSYNIYAGKYVTTSATANSYLGVDTVTTTYKRFIFKLKAYSSSAFYIYCPDLASGRYLYIANVKMENGNTATAWSLAPEDVDGKLVTSEAKITITTDGIKSTVSKKVTAPTKSGGTYVTEWKSAVRQSCSDIVYAWNQNSEIVQFENQGDGASINIKSKSGSSYYNLVKLDKSGLALYNSSSHNLQAKFTGTALSFYQSNGTTKYLDLNTTGLILYNASSVKLLDLTTAGLTFYTNGTTKLAAVTQSALTFYQSNGSTKMSVFDNTGVTLYNGSGYRISKMAADGVYVYDGTSNGYMKVWLSANGLIVYGDRAKKLITINTSDGLSIYQSDGRTIRSKFTGANALFYGSKIANVKINADGLYINQSSNSGAIQKILLNDFGITMYNTSVCVDSIYNNTSLKFYNGSSYLTTNNTGFLGSVYRVNHQIKSSVYGVVLGAYSGSFVGIGAYTTSGFAKGLYFANTKLSASVYEGNMYLTCDMYCNNKTIYNAEFHGEHTSSDGYGGSTFTRGNGFVYLPVNAPNSDNRFYASSGHYLRCCIHDGLITSASYI